MPIALQRVSAKRATLPIEQKESVRWLNGFRLASELAGKCPGTQVVSVADREVDIYDIFVEAAQHVTAADFVIRALRERSTPLRDPDSDPAAYRKVREEVRVSEIRATRTIWTGVRRMTDFAIAWINFGPDQQTTCV